MKIHEYSQAMRQILGKGNKYYVSRNEFGQLDSVSYEPRTEDQGPTDDVISQEQKPKTFYPDDSVMPSFDGMEDPKALEDYRQMELADGGVVEREGFYAGGSLEPQGETIKNLYLKGYSMDSIAEQLNVTKSNLNSFLNSIKNPEIETPITITEEESSKRSSVNPEYDEIKNLTKEEYTQKYLDGQRTWSDKVMGVSKEGRAKRDKLINSIIETNLDLNSDKKITFKKLARDAGYSNRKNIRSFPVDLNTPKENAHAYFNQLTSDLDQPLKNYKNIRDKISKKIKVPKQYVNLLLRSSERYQKLRPALLQINLPAKAAYFKKNKGTLFSEIVESIENRNKTPSNSPVVNKPGSYSKPEQKIMEYAKRHVNQGGKKIKFINTIDKDGFNEFLYKGKKYNTTNLINEGRQDKNFKEFYQTYDDRIDLLSREVIHPKTKKNTTFGNLMSEAYTKGSSLKKPISKDNVLVIDHIKGVQKDPFTNLRVLDSRTNTAGGGIKIIDDYRKAGALTKEKKFYTKDTLEKISKKTGYSYIKDKNKFFKDQLNLAEDILVKDRNLQKPFTIAKEYIKNLNPSEQKVLTKFGNQVGMGFDPTEIMNALPEREAQILRGMGSKIGNIAKLGARGLAELTTGLGPLGIGITAAVTAPFALYDVSQGDRTSEVLQNTVSDLTFGLTPRADERIIRDIGGESAVRGYEIQQNIDKFRTSRDDLKNLNEQLNDPSSTLFSEDEDSILASIERNKNIIKETATYLQPFIKEGNLVSPDYNDYLKAENKQTMEKKFTKEKRLEESNIYGGIEGETQTDFTNPELENLKKSQETLEKTYVGNQPKQPGLVGQYFGIVPNRGRVGLRLGGSKKLFNLLKKSKKDKPKKELTEKEVQDIMDDPQPENPDRRDFLKGAGALGLAVAAFGTGALKLAKTLKTKAALKVLVEPAVGQPAWFAPLVDKILLKGIRLEKDGKKLNKYVLEEDGKTITLEIPFSSPNNHIDINVKGGGAYDDPFDIYYQRTDKGLGGDKKPKSSFKVLESRPYRFGSDADEVELSEEIFQGADLLELPKGGSGILSDMEGLEKIATGKIKNPKLANTRVKIRDELNQPDNYRSRYNPGEEDRLTRSTGPDGGEYYENLDGEDYYSVKMEGDRITTKNDLDPDIDYD